MRTCIIAQFPPPIHGLSKAVDTLFNSSLKEEFSFSRINLTDNSKLIRNMIRLVNNKSELYYLTLSQSRMGNLRDLIILRIIRAKKGKCIVHLHGGYYRKMVDEDLAKWQRKLNYKAINKVDRAIVLSDSLKAVFRGMLPEDRIFVIPNCVDDEYMAFDSSERFHHTGCKHVLYLSNFIESKGYRDVLQMALLEKKERKGYHFDFAGGFPSEDEKSFFEFFITSNGLQDTVTYHGVVTGEDKRNLLKSSDIFVLLTNYPKEGQPISILEAMGNGMAIITTAHAGIPDIVKDGVNGIVVPCKYTVSEIFEKMQTLDIEKIDKVNHTEIMSDYSEQKYIENMHSVMSFV